MSTRKPVALTMGDPSGIGGEITAGAWRQREKLPPFFTIDDPARLRALAPDVPLAEITTPAEAMAAWPDHLPVLSLDPGCTVRPGVPEPRAAAATIASIDRAVALASSGEAAAVVTNPITKKLLYEGAGFAHPGHTEYLAHLAGVPRTVMMLAVPGLRVVPVTIHVPLADVPRLLTGDEIVETARIAAADLTRWFGIARPRLAVAGLNPHAGEGGTIGRDEIDTVIPAIERLRAEGLDVAGPLPADTMFHPAARERYDVALAMYHDQALVPVKTLDFANGVNVTLGLPFIRTSPDHGTAYDIAGTGRADPSSLIAAIRMAGEMAATARP